MEDAKKINIKNIIIDIDGVIVGKNEGVNFPLPNEEVINKLREVKQKGINISLCTAKPCFAITEVVQKVGLDVFHIVNGGGLIVNPISNEILKQYIIDMNEARKLVNLCMTNNVRIEAFTKDKYYIFLGEDVELTKKRETILRQKAIIISSVDEIINEDIIEFKVIAHKDKVDNVTNLFNNENMNLSLNWAFHPAILPLHTGSVTVKGISKKQGLLDITDHIGISFDNTLGIGDGMNDWNFMQLCKYTASMGNDEQLQARVSTKGGYIGTDVDVNGVIDILDYFLELNKKEHRREKKDI